MTLDEALAVVDLMGCYVDVWRPRDKTDVHYNLRDPDHIRILMEDTKKDVYIDVRSQPEGRGTYRYNSLRNPYEEAVAAFIKWVETGIHPVNPLGPHVPF